MKPSERLVQNHLRLPAAPAPVANYIPANRCGAQVFTSGQLPFQDGKLLHKGKIPTDVSVEDAVDGARIAALNAVAAAASVVGGVDNIVKVVRVAVFVASSPGFTQQPNVADGASGLLVKVFGDAGRHARAAVGVAELPLGASVEVELLVEVRD